MATGLHIQKLEILLTHRPGKCMKSLIFTKVLVALLLSSFWTSVKAQGNPCPQTPVETGRVKIEKGVGQKFLVGIVKKETADTLFSYLSSLEHIPYKYVVDGCDVRAYLAAKELKEKWNIESFRVNMESYPNMIAKTPFTAEGWVDFSKHSALALCVYKPETQTVTPMVFDNAFFDGPKEVDDWRKSLTDEFSDRQPDLYYSGMYNLNPEERHKKKFSRKELACAEEVRLAFLKEEEKIEKGQLPYGIGRSKEVLRLNLCQ